MNRLFLIIDAREEYPYLFQSFNEKPMIDRELLNCGDYTIRGFETEFAIEYKTYYDLLNCLTQEFDRFEAQIRRGKAYCKNFFVMVNGYKTQFDQELHKNQELLKRFNYLKYFVGMPIEFHQPASIEKRMWDKIKTFFNAAEEAHKNGLLPKEFNRVFQWTQPARN